MSSNRKIGAMGLFAGALFLTLSAAQATETCQPFSLVSDPDRRLVQLVDLGDPGATPGDVRIGYTTLHDQAGSEVGYIRWTVQSLGREENLSDAVLVLENGQIHLRHLFRPAREHDEKVSTILVEGIEGVVLGERELLRTLAALSSCRSVGTA